MLKANFLDVARGLILLTMPHGTDAFCAKEIVAVKTSGNSAKVRDVQITCKCINDVKPTAYEIEAVPSKTVDQLFKLLEAAHG